MSTAADTRRFSAAIASCAWRSVTPAFSRATVCTSCHPKFRNLAGVKLVGIQTSMSRAGMK